MVYVHSIRVWSPSLAEIDRYSLLSDSLLVHLLLLLTLKMYNYSKNKNETTFIAFRVLWFDQKWFWNGHVSANASLLIGRCMSQKCWEAQKVCKFIATMHSKVNFVSTRWNRRLKWLPNYTVHGPRIHETYWITSLAFWLGPHHLSSLILTHDRIENKIHKISITWPSMLRTSSIRSAC